MNKFCWTDYIYHNEKGGIFINYIFIYTKLVNVFKASLIKG